MFTSVISGSTNDCEIYAIVGIIALVSTVVMMFVKLGKAKNKEQAARVLLIFPFIILAIISINTYYYNKATGADKIEHSVGRLATELYLSKLNVMQQDNPTEYEKAIKTLKEWQESKENQKKS